MGVTQQGQAARHLTVQPMGGAGAATCAPAEAATPALRRETLRDLAAAGVMVLACGAAIAAWVGFGADAALRAAFVYAVGACFVWRGLAAHPHARFGAANRITLLRFALAAVLAALVGEPTARGAAAAWAVVVVATLAALLDAADGPLARRSGLASAFGARFDMETDAWFTLVLCALVVHFDKAGAWVLASGLMRYAFVAAAWALPWLAAPLPPSRRRQAVCVAQITALIVCLGPVVPRPAASLLAALALAALAASFAADLYRLARRRHLETER